VVRLAAAAEVAAAIVLLIPMPAVSAVGAAGGALLGLSFAALGVAGMARGSQVPCGCLGHANGRALGGANVVIGLSIVAVMLLCLAVRPVISPVWVALFTLAIPLWSNRGLARRLLGKGSA
jgi:Methylamine utilisation protein MauE